MSRFAAWYVNLDSRPDRRERMERELARVGVEAERFPALRPDAYDGPPERIAAMLARPQRGAIGCWLSQRAVLMLGLELGGERDVLVLEDDVEFCDDLGERIDYCYDRLLVVDPEWDVLSLGACFHVPAVWHAADAIGRDAEPTLDPRIVRVYGSWFTWAWIVRRGSLERVVSLLDEVLPVSWGIDHSFILLGDRVRAYCFVPGCSRQVDGRSDIGAGDTIFSTFARLGPHWYQPRAGDFDPASIDWGRR